MRYGGRFGIVLIKLKEFSHCRLEIAVFASILLELLLCIYLVRKNHQLHPFDSKLKRTFLIIDNADLVDRFQAQWLRRDWFSLCFVPRAPNGNDFVISNIPSQFFVIA